MKNTTNRLLYAVHPVVEDDVDTQITVTKNMMLIALERHTSPMTSMVTDTYPLMLVSQ